MTSQKLFAIFILLISFSTLLSCASYQSKVSGSRDLIKKGQVDEAVEKFQKQAEEPGRDQLVYMMEYATALQIAGRYKQSAEAFNKADQLVDVNDFHSVSAITMATLGSEEMIQYKGESYEKFLINTMNAINYLMMGQFDDAMVEARRINDKISKMKMDGREPYEQSPFARYLAAMLWEAEKKYDDSYIEYQASYKLDGTNPWLPSDLIRTSKLARRMDDYQEWKKDFTTVKEDPSWYDKNMSELIVIYQQGWGPEKHTRKGTYRFPELDPVRSQTQRAQVKINDGQINETARVVYDVERVAITTLEKDFGALVARRIGGIAAKAVVADQIRQKNPLLGDLSWIAMNIADRPDLRQWSTLPQTIQVARIRLKPGTYKVAIQGLDSSGNPTNDSMPERSITLKAGQKQFLNWRSLY